jgi:hypothetical protein
MGKMFTEKTLKAMILNAATMIDASEQAEERKINKQAWKLYNDLKKMEERGEYDSIFEQE